ncbi:MAG: hypothetical protein JWP14_544 [Frankiales bacterium]|nr:hypothetical protein [Frankiales bacterium]
MTLAAAGAWLFETRDTLHCVLVKVSRRLRDLDDRTGAGRLGTGALYVLPLWTGIVGLLCIASSIAGIIKDVPEAVMPSFLFAGRLTRPLRAFLVGTG